MLDSLNEPLRFAKKKPRRKLRKPKLLEENIKQDDLKLSTEYVSPKKLKIKTSAIKKIEKTMTKINRKKRNISSKFDKILKSIEIDRPILLKDKIETLWRDKSKSKSYQSLRWQIEKKKYKRMQCNADLKQVYRLLLNYIKERNRQSEKLIPLDVEVDFLDSIKLICESGWVIEEKDLYDMLETLGICDSFEDQIFYFLLYFIDLMKFDRKQLLEYFKDKGVDTKMVEKRMRDVNKIMSESPKRRNDLFPI